MIERCLFVASLRSAAWTLERVRGFRNHHGIAVFRDGEWIERGEITLEAAAKLIGVCNMTALRMLRRGDIKGRQACTVRGKRWKQTPAGSRFPVLRPARVPMIRSNKARGDEEIPIHLSHYAPPQPLHRPACHARQHASARRALLRPLLLELQVADQGSNSLVTSSAKVRKGGIGNVERHSEPLLHFTL
jgi:hypothetical protein